MKKRTLSLLLASMLIGCTAIAQDLEKYPWLDKSKTFHERAVLLVKELTLREKVDQLGNNVSEAIKRDGIIIVPAYQYWNEAIHGVARSGAATSFPESKGMSATWNPQLVFDCANAISDEARWYHVNKGKGLNYWSPTINMARDPRWGREEENYGEDPFLAGTLAVQFVKGFQGEITPETPYYKLVATAKHFAANNYERGRQSTTSFVTEKNMREYYLPAFKMCVEQADVKSIMAAYNALSVDLNEKDANNLGYEKSHGGLPCAGNKMLLTDILRKEWGFSGYVTSDCAGVACIHRATKHLYFGPYTAGTIDDGIAFSTIHNPYQNATEEEQIMEARSTALAIKAGLDTNCEFMSRSSVLQRAGVNAVTPEFQAKEQAAANGQKYVTLTEEDIDQAVIRVLETRFALGEFDNYDYPVSNTLESEANQTLALKAAQESIVLMKNEKANESDAAPLLPISTDKKVALIGPYANAIMLGDYSGTPTYTTTPFEAFSKKMNFVLETKLIASQLNAVPFSQAVVSKRGAAKNDTGAGNLENTAPGDIFLYKDVYFGEMGCTQFEMSCGAKDTGLGSVSFILDDKNGTPFLTVDNENTGSWTKWTTISASFDAATQQQLKGTHDLYVKFSGTKSYVGNYLYFHFSNPDEEIIPNTETQGPLYMCTTSASVNEVATAAMIDRAKAVAQKADVVVFVGGTDFSKPDDHATGTEGHDRWKITLPGNQEEVLKAVKSVNPNVVLVLESGSSLDISWAKENIPAIIEAWYGGQAQGQAICDAIYGDINPGGKLTSTWYNNVEELPSANSSAKNYSTFGREGMMEYNIDDWGYTYMYYGKGKKNPCQAAKPMYPFGYGLSYTTFSYGDFNIPSNFKIGKTEDVTLKVTNTGTREGDEVIQVYASFPGSTVGRPIKKLVGFQRVTVPVGESVEVTIPVAHENFSYYDENTHTFRTESAAQLQIATSSADEDVKYQQAVNTEAGTVEETYISTHIDEIPAVSQRQLLKTDHIYNVMGAYVGPASCFDRLPQGVYVLNGVKYIKK